jgi:NADH-quinone oxidoreductase subunit A
MFLVRQMPPHPTLSPEYGSTTLTGARGEGFCHATTMKWYARSPLAACVAIAFPSTTHKVTTLMNATIMMTSCGSLLADLGTNTRTSWIPVVLLLAIGIGFAVVNVAASIIIGPGRTGPGKEQTYESGMVPIGDTRRRFNVRFYIVAMIFLVFDVEIVFLYPWATIFARGVAEKSTAATGSFFNGSALLWEMVVFVVLLLVAYIYAWGKGIFRWD